MFGCVVQHVVEVAFVVGPLSYRDCAGVGTGSLGDELLEDKGAIELDGCDGALWVVVLVVSPCCESGVSSVGVVTVWL